jgi:hypothetical protein
MKVKETMHKGVDWVDPDTPVTDLAKLMRQHDIAEVGSGRSAWASSPAAPKHLGRD